MLEVVGGKGCHHNVRVHLETQVLSITRSKDLVKLRALSKLCFKNFFDDPSLLVVAMPPVVEKKVRGKKKQKKKKNDPRKVEILDACAELRRACGWVGDWDDARHYLNLVRRRRWGSTMLVQELLIAFPWLSNPDENLVN